MKSLLKSGGKLHWVKNLYRRYKYGGGCCDIYNLDNYLVKKILKPLKEFRRSLSVNGGGYPCELKSMEEWLDILDKMIWAFQFLIDGEDIENWTVEKDIEASKKAQEGYELFGKYFRSLWV